MQIGIRKYSEHGAENRARDRPSAKRIPFCYY